MTELLKILTPDAALRSWQAIYTFRAPKDPSRPFLVYVVYTSMMLTGNKLTVRRIPLRYRMLLMCKLS